MKKLSTNQIRTMWLDFFKEKNHHFLPPASLIPVNDPSLLWINSGVATLKPYFDGRLSPPSPRLVNSQKAIRTNDIENVGVTARHQTMFEMLGNFSIGDYFKKEAISFAWELLTSPQWFAIDPQRLYITVFKDDQETYNLWIKEIGIASDHIFKMGRSTNFWDIGQGPSGPNTEIFFDRGSKWDPKGLGTKLIKDDIENDRYIEIWNIVFSQFNNDGKGNYSELPRKNIDTGAGLERLASIFQDTSTNFETDIFLPTIKKIETLTTPNIRYQAEDYFKPKAQQTKINTAFKVIADHLRAVIFAINEGVFPSNKDRGYVVRRLLRRAQVYGLELGLNEAFLYRLVETSIDSMKAFYPDLLDHKDLITTTILNEEKRFLMTLARGYKLLNQMISKNKQLTAEDAWLLFESFGFPMELTQEIANQHQIKIDINDFKKLSETAKNKARKSRQKNDGWNKQSSFYTQLDVPSKFTGWTETSRQKAKVAFIFQNETSLETIKNNQGFVILDQTPFYAEKGGQAADHGLLIGPKGRAKVIDVQEGPQHQPIHQVVVEGEIKKGDFVQAIVDPNKRHLTQKNHSATHLLHSALRQVLGNEVKQSGSYNDEKGLRLDFSFHRPLTNQELISVQKMVNEHIKLNHQTEVLFVTLDEAINKHHALAFFGDKYDQSKVRVVKFADFSCELCGGTHVHQTKEIENFLITEVNSKGKGLFRIKAITSNETIKSFLKQKYQEALININPLVNKYQKSTHKNLALETIFQKINNFQINSNNWNQLNDLTLEAQRIFAKYETLANKRIQDKKLLALGKKLIPQLQKDGVHKIEFFTENLTLNDLKQLADDLRHQYSNLIAILGSQTEKSGFLVVAISPQLKSKYSAIKIFRNLPGYQTQGGGNETFAQGKYQPK